MSRTYRESCSAAHALDLIGERWALLVVRELLLGPKRFTDVCAGLPQASPNVLSQRLRELADAGVVLRRRLPPPAGVWVYELTEWGLELEQVLLALARWGSRSPLRDLRSGASVDALMLALRSGFDPAVSGDLRAGYALHVGEHSFALHVADGRLTVARDHLPAEPDAVIETDRRTLHALLTRSRDLDVALGEAEHITVTGDVDAVRRLLNAVTPAHKSTE
ncbi:MAG: winged helix-turn-helix transcriptional regulator [Pseudonocardia sp.]|nr:winged helix-turn-helix transcriptional regulator [Pseudonocardia sp.]